MNGESYQTEHAIVCGFGHLGNRIAAQLRDRGKQVVVIDRNPDEGLRAAIRALGCEVIVGDITDDEILELAGIHSASCFIAATGDDCANLEAAISARQMNEGLSVVLRLSDELLARRVGSVFDILPLSAASLASPAFVSAATDDSIVAMFVVDDQPLSIYRDRGACREEHTRGVNVRKSGSHLSIAADHEEISPADECLFVAMQSHKGSGPARKSKPHRDRVSLDLLKTLHPALLYRGAQDVWHHMSGVTRGLLTALVGVGLLSVMVFSLVGGMSLINALYFVVTTMTTVGYGDINLQNAPIGLKIYGIIMMLCGAGLLATVYAIIADRVLAARLEHLLGRRGVGMRDHTVIVGLGNVGYRIAHDLSVLGIEVAAIELCEDSDTMHTARSMFPVVIGDATRPSILEKAGIDKAKTLIAATDDSIANLSIALHARGINPDIRIVVRTYEYALADKFRKLNLDNVLSTSAIAAPTFVDSALTPGVQGSFKCGDEDILVLRHEVGADSPLIGRTVRAVCEDHDIAVVAVKAPGHTRFETVTPDTTIAAESITILLIVR